MTIMQKGPKYLLCENLQTNPEGFFVLYNRSPFILYEFNEDLDIVSVKYLGEHPSENRKKTLQIHAKRWLIQYLKDTVSNK